MNSLDTSTQQMAGSSVPSPSLGDDAEILHAAAEIVRLEALYSEECREVNEKRPGHAERAAAITDRQTPFIEFLAERRSVTIEGIKAKAAALAAWAPDMIGPGDGDSGKIMTKAILWDLLGQPADDAEPDDQAESEARLLPVFTMPADPDAGLKALCRQLVASVTAINERHLSDPAAADRDLDADDPRLLEQDRLMEAILSMAPVMLGGHRARAFACLEWTGGVGADGTPASQLSDRVFWPIIRDLVGTDVIEASARDTVRLNGDGEETPDLRLHLKLLMAAMFGLPGAVVADPDAGILAACAEVRRLRAEGDAATPFSETFSALCGQHRAAALALAGMTARTGAGLAAQAALILEEQADTRLEGFDHSTAENMALVMLKRLAVDAPAAPAIHLDAELIALCDELIAAEAEWSATDGHQQDVLDALGERSGKAFERILELQPRTPAGQRATARALLAFMPRHLDGQLDVEINHIGERLAWKLVQQLAAGDLTGGADRTAVPR